jgi:hypothetical protein
MESKLTNDQISWKDTYIIEKDNIEKIQKQFIYKSNIVNKYIDEWDNLQSQIKHYANIHQINEW